MTEQQIDTIVNLILQRLQPAVLVMVTSADGYRDLIHQRLARCGERLHLALDETISDSERWQQIGDVIPAKTWQHKLPSTPYKALLLPFLSYPLAVDIVNGTLQSPVAQRVHDALLAGYSGTGTALLLRSAQRIKRASRYCSQRLRGASFRHAYRP